MMIKFEEELSIFLTSSGVTALRIIPALYKISVRVKLMAS